MTVATALPHPTHRPLSSGSRGLIMASLAAAVGLAGYAWLKQLPSAVPTARLIVLPETVADSGLFAEDHSWWSGNVGSTAGMFECRPTGGGAAMASVVVWTDQANHIVAFGPSAEGADLPAYARALAGSAAVDSSQPAHVAVKGHVVLAAGKKNTLQLKGMKLDCDRTWDD